MTAPTLSASGGVQVRRHAPRPLRWVVFGFLLLLLVAILLPRRPGVPECVQDRGRLCRARSYRLADIVHLGCIVSFWNSVNFGAKLWNSILISTCVAVLGVSLSVLSAYAIGIGRIRGGAACSSPCSSSG